MAKKKVTTDTIITELAQELLKQLLIEGKVVVSQADDSFLVDIETEESGLLIGYHGQTPNSFQLILGMMVYKRLGEWARLIVNVGDYRQKREETIKSLALRTASEVALTKQAKALPFLVPFERRIVHMTLADHPDVESASEGEGKDRKIIVKPKE